MSNAPPPIPPLPRDGLPPARPAPSEMIPFLLKIGLFVALQAVLAIGLILCDPQPAPYMAAYPAKRALAESAPAPRVVLVGGSNLAFGVDSVELGRALGRRPVNLGLHGGLGDAFILNQAASVVRPGDLVILSLEYGALPPTAVLNDLLYQEPAAAVHLDAAGRRLAADTALDYFVLRARGAARRLLLSLFHQPAAVRPLYSAAGFDASGDFVAHRSLTLDPGRELLGAIASETPPGKLDRAAAFADAVAAAGAALVVAYPPMPQAAYEAHRANLVAWDRALRDRLPVPFLNTPGEAALPEEMFFDTPYHLTGEGADRRTADLIARLRASGRAAAPRHAASPQP